MNELICLPVSSTQRSLKHVGASHPPNIYKKPSTKHAECLELTENAFEIKRLS